MMPQMASGLYRVRVAIEIWQIMDRFRKSRGSVFWILLAVNIPGVVLFIYFASGVWAPRGQEGLYYDAGDSVAWTLMAFPLLAVSTLINFIVSRSVLIRLFYCRDWRLFSVWLVIVTVWFAAFKYDAGRHFDGSRMSAQDSVSP
jgi:hypothetical protein